MRLQRDERADRGGGVLAHGDAHALRLLARDASFEAVQMDDNAVAALALLAHLHETGHADGRCRNAQHRMRDTRGVERGDGKAAGQASKGQRQRKPDGASPRQDGSDDGECRERQHRPQRRLAIGGEIENDAGAEGDGEPGKQPAGRDFRDGPLGDDLPQPPEPGLDLVRQREPGAPARGANLRHPGFGALLSIVRLLDHGAAPPTSTRNGPC
jgi:hypothetical protein